MRLIDADAFAEFLKDVVKQQKYENLKIDGLLTVADVIEAIISELDGTSLDGFKNAPTIDAVPVVHGKWIYEGARGRFPVCRCSVCGNVENADWAMISGKVNYCPNCGAHMVKGDNNATLH